MSQTEQARPANAHEAVAHVIKTAGWDQMAKDWIKWPHQREQIARVVAKDLRKRFSAKMADDFVRLATAARQGGELV